MKNKITKKRAITMLVIAALGLLGGLGIVTAYVDAPSALELAEKNYKLSLEQKDFWINQNKRDTCILIDEKLTHHAALHLEGKEIERLAQKKRTECEGL